MLTSQRLKPRLFNARQPAEGSQRRDTILHQLAVFVSTSDEGKRKLKWLVSNCKVIFVRA
jgi:hypothetical protein